MTDEAVARVNIHNDQVLVEPSFGFTEMTFGHFHFMKASIRCTEGGTGGRAERDEL